MKLTEDMLRGIEADLKEVKGSIEQPSALQVARLIYNLSTLVEFTKFALPLVDRVGLTPFSPEVNAQDNIILCGSYVPDLPTA